MTYELLQQRCASMGAVPPTLEQFAKAKGNPVMHEISSPTEGVVVLNPPSAVQSHSETSDNKEKNNEGNLKAELQESVQEASAPSPSPPPSTTEDASEEPSLAKPKKKKSPETTQV